MTQNEFVRALEGAIKSATAKPFHHPEDLMVAVTAVTEAIYEFSCHMTGFTNE